MSVVQWTIKSSLGLVLLERILAILLQDLGVPLGLEEGIFWTFKNLSCLTESNPSLFLPRGVLELLSSGHFSQWCWEEDASWMAEGRVGMKEPFATAVHECLELPWQRGLDPWCQITAQLLNRIELSAACSLTLGTWMMSPPSVFIEWTLYCWALPWLSFCQLRTWGQ